MPDNNIELLDALEAMARQHCTSDETGHTDSMGISANGEALELLAEHGRFLVERVVGRRVIGYWPATYGEAAK